MYVSIEFCKMNVSGLKLVDVYQNNTYLIISVENINIITNVIIYIS